MKNRNIKNALYSILDTLFLPFLMLLVTPIFIKYLGIDKYGIWMLISSLVVAMSVLNIGGVDTVIKYISSYRHSNDLKSINEIFSTVFVTQVLFATIIAILSFIIPSFIINSHLFNLNTENHDIFIISFQFGILLFALKLLEQIIFAYFKGYERFDIASKLSISSKFIMILVQLLTVLNNGNLIDIFRNSFIFLVAVVSLELLFIKYQNEKIHFFKDFKMYRIKEIFHFTKWSWIISIVGTLSGQMDRWVVASLANMTLLGYYSIALLVFKNIHSIFASSMSWVFPKISKEQNNKKNIYKTYLFLQGILFLGSVFVSYFLIYFNTIFLVWLDNETYLASIEYIKNLLVLLPLYSLGIIPFFVVKATGNIKYNFYSDIVTLFLRVSLMYLLYEIYAINGIIMAIAFSGLFLVVYLSLIVKLKVLQGYNIKLYSIIPLPLLYIVFVLSNSIIISLICVISILYLYYFTFYSSIKILLLKKGLLK